MPGCVRAAGSAACPCKSQLASLLACQIPLKLGLPPTRAGRAAWPDVRVIDTEITALTAAAAIATVIIELENRSRTMVSFCSFFGVTATDSLQRPQNPWRCLLLPGQDLVPPQRRGLPCALPAAATGENSFLRRSEVRNTFCSPGRSVW